MLDLAITLWANCQELLDSSPPTEAFQVTIDLPVPFAANCCVKRNSCFVLQFAFVVRVNG